MKINFHLPGRLHLPYRVNRAITGFLYAFVDEKIWQLRRSGFFADEDYSENVDQNVETFMTWRKLLLGHFLVGTEICHVMNTAVVWVEFVWHGLVLYIQVEDWQEFGPEWFDNTGIYGSYLHLYRRNMADFKRDLASLKS